MNLMKKSSILLTAIGTFLLTSCSGTQTFTAEQAKNWMKEHGVQEIKSEGKYIKNLKFSWDFGPCVGDNGLTEEEAAALALAQIKVYSTVYIGYDYESIIEKEIGTLPVAGTKWVTVKDDALKQSGDSSVLQYSQDGKNYKGNPITGNEFSLVDGKYLVVKNNYTISGLPLAGYQYASLNTNGYIDGVRDEVVIDTKAAWLVTKFDFATPAK